MSLKSLSRTRWKIENSKVTIYPYGSSYIIGAILAIFFAGVTYFFMRHENSSIGLSVPVIFVCILIVLLFWAFAGTSIEFDNGSGIMRKRLLGFIPVATIPFTKLHGISPVSSMYGAYTYRLFKKDNRYGKGILVSSSYTKNDDPNAVAFVDEAVTTVHSYLDAHDSPSDFVVEPITNYQYFNNENGTFTIKRNKVGGLVLGLILLAVGIHELTPAAWMEQDLSVGRICFLLFCIVGGAAIALSAFTVVSLDAVNRTVQRKSPIGLGNRSYSFDDFDGVQTVRKSTNFIYTGTDVRLYFINPNTSKQETLPVQSFFRSKNVERFVREITSILETKKYQSY